jgi:hypothetical protein
MERDSFSVPTNKMPTPVAYIIGIERNRNQNPDSYLRPLSELKAAPMRINTRIPNPIPSTVSNRGMTCRNSFQSKTLVHVG